MSAAQATDNRRSPVSPGAPLEGIALTFDDGPDPHGTPAVLAALREVDAAATFFVIAPAAERHPDLIARIAADGHRLALHCDAHVRHSERERDEVRHDTERALDRLDRLGVRPHLWRTPWGDTAPWTAELADEFGLRLVGWDLDTHDWRGDSAATMFAATEGALGPGTVVLAHDGIGPGARRSSCEETAAYVRLAGDAAARRGWPTERLS